MAPTYTYKTVHYDDLHYIIFGLYALFRKADSRCYSLTHGCLLAVSALTLVSPYKPCMPVVREKSHRYKARTGTTARKRNTQTPNAAVPVRRVNRAEQQWKTVHTVPHA